MRGSAVAVIVVLAAAPAFAATAPPVHGAHGAVASDHVAASQAGLDVLRAGGNAIDAACATALALGVVVPQSSGLGGGGFALVYLAKAKQVYALDFRETAPAAIKPELFMPGGTLNPALSRRGGLAVAVPGEARGLSELVRRWGRLPFAKCVAPAERLARDGVPATPRIASIANQARREGANGVALIEALWGVHADVTVGDRLRRAALATTLAELRKRGADVIYTGPIAAAIVDEVKKQGGVLTLEDLRTYAPKDRQPFVTTFRGQTVYTMPPSSSGGIVISEALGILSNRFAAGELQKSGLGPSSSLYLHTLVEALKHGFADRARHMGDPDFVQVPTDHLLSADYHRELAARIRVNGVLPSAQYGTPGPTPDPKVDHGTTHLSVMDSEGNAVALTTTVNLWFGSGVVAGRTGIVLNDQMDDFAIKAGAMNAFGLVGAENNAVAPGKRPLSSMSPTLVLDDKGARVAVGGAGGPTIISGTLQVLLNVLEFGMDAQAASAQPRVHHQWVPDVLNYEDELPRDVVQALEARGHKTKPREHITSVNVVVRAADGHGFDAASEYRSGGVPAAY